MDINLSEKSALITGLIVNVIAATRVVLWKLLGLRPPQRPRSRSRFRWLINPALWYLHSRDVVLHKTTIINVKH